MSPTRRFCVRYWLLLAVGAGMAGYALAGISPIVDVPVATESAIASAVMRLLGWGLDRPLWFALPFLLVLALRWACQPQDRHKLLWLAGLGGILFVPPSLLLLLTWWYTADLQLIDARPLYLIARKSREPGSAPPGFGLVALEDLPGAQGVRLLDADQLRQAARKPLDRRTLFDGLTLVDEELKLLEFEVYILVKDIDRNGTPDIILFITWYGDEKQVSWTVSYDVVAGKPRILFAYNLRQNVFSLAPPFMAMDAVGQGPEGTLTIRLFQAMFGTMTSNAVAPETSIIAFDAATGRYTKTRVPLGRLMAFWPLAVLSILNPWWIFIALVLGVPAVVGGILFVGIRMLRHRIRNRC